MRTKAFTWIELFIVMFIISILAHLTNGMIDYQKNQSYAQTIFNTFLNYEGALNMYMADHNGTLSDLSTIHGKRLSSIDGLKPYLPAGTQNVKLPLEVEIVGYNLDGIIGAVIAKIPATGKESFLKALKKLFSDYAGETRVQIATKGNYTEIGFVIKEVPIN